MPTLGSPFPQALSGNQSVQQSASRSTSTPGIVPGMLDVYNQLLGKNEANYSNLLNAYTQGQDRLTQQLPGINQGYNTLSNQVQERLGVTGGGWGVAAPAAQQIGEQFTRARGTTDQQMINAGLGNTTIRGNLQNQNALQAGRATADLGAQLAGLAAQYQSQLGQAGLASQMQGLGMQTGLTQNQLGNLAGHRFANTAGDLTGQTSTSESTSTGTSLGSSTSGSGPGGSGGGTTGMGRGQSGGAPAGHIPWAAGMGGNQGYLPGNQGIYPIDGLGNTLGGPPSYGGTGSTAGSRSGMSGLRTGFGGTAQATTQTGNPSFRSGAGVPGSAVTQPGFSVPGMPNAVGPDGMGPVYDPGWGPQTFGDLGEGQQGPAYDPWGDYNYLFDEATPAAYSDPWSDYGDYGEATPVDYSDPWSQGWAGDMGPIYDSSGSDWNYLFDEATPVDYSDPWSDYGDYDFGSFEDLDYFW